MAPASDEMVIPLPPNEIPDDSGARFDARGLAGMIEAQAARTPTATAVKFGDKLATYCELNAAANRLAHWLIRHDVKAEEAVGVCLTRSIELIVAVLAIVKAGGAYVPLDPSYPAERLRFMQEDSQPRIVLSQRSQAGRLGAGGVVCLDEMQQSLVAEFSGNPDVPVPSDSLAYLMYTSGSTGQPKAVAMEQGPLCNLLLWQMAALPDAAVTLQFASLNFDVSFQEIFSTLATGGTLVLVDEAIRRDPPALLKLIEAARVERLFLPFVALQNLAATAEVGQTCPSHLHEVITAGEQLRITPQIRDFFTRMKGCVLHNHYGPTESHVVTAHTLRGDPAEWPSVAPIGMPIDGAGIHILDEAMNALPPGEAGEIYIGGPCIARGYLRRAELTAQRFVRNPFSGDASARLYRTGDRARSGADGIIEFLGRNDGQIKIRGVRVEPGEVEAALSQHPALEQVAVTAHEHAGQGQRLAAYFVARAGHSVSRGELRSFLSAKLPQPLLPSAFVALDRMPLTPSGKVDRLALPAPSLQQTERSVQPRTDLEKRLVPLWEEALDIRPVGIRDDFSELGGDSLMAVHLALTIEKKLGFRVPVETFYEFPTIEALVKYFAQGAKPPEVTDMVRLNAAGTKPPLFSILGSLSVGRHLGPDQPFFQLLASAVAPGPFMKIPLDRTSSADNAIGELAEHCIERIVKVQPHGPYYLSGYSLGGIVAYEIAHRLHLNGEAIAFLGLIDPDPPRPTPIRSLRRDIHRLGLWPVAKRQIKRLLKSNGQTPPAAIAYHDMPTEEKVMLFPGHYDAPPCPVPLTLFLAKDHYAGDPHEPVPDPRLDWTCTAMKGFTVHEIPGTHFTLNDEPHSRVLADRLRRCLAKVISFVTVLPMEAQSSIECLAV